MRSFVSLAQRVVMVVLVAFLVARLADTHLHVCLDGQEAPLTVHVADASVHNDVHHDEAQPHDDIDIEVTDAALKKKGAVDLDVLAVVAVVLVLPLPVVDRAWTAVLRADPLVALPSDLKPPLRGPPRNSLQA